MRPPGAHSGHGQGESAGTDGSRYAPECGQTKLCPALVDIGVYRQDKPMVLYTYNVRYDLLASVIYIDLYMMMFPRRIDLLIISLILLPCKCR